MKTWGACLLVLALAGCGGGKKDTVVPAKAAPTPAKDAAPWPAPADPMKLTEAGGTDAGDARVRLPAHPRASRRLRQREPMPVPAGIGIDIDDPAVQRLQAPDGSIGYGGISPPCADTVHLSAAHAFPGRRAPHGGEGEPVQHARRVLHGMGRPARPRTASAATASPRRRSRSTSTASPTGRIRGRSSSRTSGRSQSSSGRLRPRFLRASPRAKLRAWRRSRRTPSSVGRS